MVAASERFKSGSNPRPIDVTGNGATCKVLLFWFNETDRFPLRMTRVPSSTKVEFEDLVAPTAEEAKAMEPLVYTKGHKISLRKVTINAYCKPENSYMQSSHM